MEIPADIDLLAHIEAFLERTGMGHAKFGLRATGEGGLVKSIRDGRSLSLRNAKRVTDFMKAYDAEHEAENADRCGNDIAGKSDDFTARPEWPVKKVGAA